MKTSANTTQALARAGPLFIHMWRRSVAEAVCLSKPPLPSLAVRREQRLVERCVETGNRINLKQPARWYQPSSWKRTSSVSPLAVDQLLYVDCSELPLSLAWSDCLKRILLLFFLHCEGVGIRLRLCHSEFSYMRVKEAIRQLLNKTTTREKNGIQCWGICLKHSLFLPFWKATV